MAWQERLSSHPEICGGKVCVKGTRIMVSVILDNIAAGVSTATILKEYPSLKEDDIKATLQYAADISNDRFISFEPKAS